MLFTVWLQVTIYAAFVAPLWASPLFADWLHNDASHQHGKRDDSYSTLKWRKEDFFVDGRHIPGVNFTVGDSYAGLLPVSDDRKASKLFFWYWPTPNTIGKDDLVFWNGGGPGCSGISAQLAAIGPFILPYNMNGSVPNTKYDWTQLSNIVFLDYPTGTGLSMGTPYITNEEQLAIEWYGFVTRFFQVFPELKGKRFWLSGGSYAGMSEPYIVQYIALQEKLGKNAEVGINYQGMLLFDPVLVDDIIGQDIPSVDLALKYQNVMGLNQTFLNDLVAKAKDLGAYDYIKDNLNYPPKDGKISIPPTMYASDYSLYLAVRQAAKDSNPCFTVYDVRFQCPIPYDQLGSPPGGHISANNFVNNVTGFREYIHADPSQTWWTCSVIDVFLNGTDTSPPPADIDLLQKVLEYGPAQRNVIAHGEYDFILKADGTALALQNTTWFGKQGFQKPLQPFHVGGKEVGVIQIERGLLFARLSDSGHRIVRNAPDVAYKMQQYMLGQVSAKDMMS